MRAVIRECPSVDDARYLHGDVSIRNIAMRSYDPLRISLSDPNPLCGDPSWDIAPITNNVEYGERRHRSDERPSETLLLRDRELLAGFWDTYPQVIPDQSLLTAQLVQGARPSIARPRRTTERSTTSTWPSRTSSSAT